MVFPLGDEVRVVLTSSTVESIRGLDNEHSEHVRTELIKIAEAGHSPARLSYTEYGDLTVFRCGDVMRLFGVVLEDIAVIEEFDHVVIILAVSAHDYEAAGVSRHQADRIAERFSSFTNAEEFRAAVDGTLFDADALRRL